MTGKQEVAKRMCQARKDKKTNSKTKQNNAEEYKNEQKKYELNENGCAREIKYDMHSIFLLSEKKSQMILKFSVFYANH